MLPVRKVLSLHPQTVASNGTNGFLVADLRPTTGVRFDYAQFDVELGPGASTAAPITVSLLESDDTNSSNYAAVMPFVGGTATSASVGFVLPSYATSAASGLTFSFGVDGTKRKRYLKLSVVPGTTAVVAIRANLMQANNNLAANTTDCGGDFFIIG